MENLVAAIRLYGWLMHFSDGGGGNGGERGKLGGSKTSLAMDNGN